MNRRCAVLIPLALPVLSCWSGTSASDPPPVISSSDASASFASRLADAALERTGHPVRYDGSYRKIPYPGGDVPDHVGVCTDLVIRSYRALGIDLQRLVHEDMAAAFSAYPDRWGMAGPDPNIDHRRVPNLETYFTRHGQAVPITERGEDYLPGDLVTWMVGPLPHIGIVSAIRSTDGSRFRVVHNIGRGPELEDMLFDFPIVGHFRFVGHESATDQGD